MKRIYRNAVSAGLALALASAPLALAQQQQDHNQGDQQHSNNYGPDQHNANMGEQHSYSSGQHPMNSNQMSMGHPQYGNQGHEDHHWQHGGYYSGQRHVVHNWDHYRLSPPPYGYEWVQDGSQFVLIAIASGIIAQVLMNAMAPQ